MFFNLYALFCSECKLTISLSNLKNLVDAYRQLHPIPKKAYSFVIERKGRVVAKRRFDHFFLSKEFKIKSIEYLHQFRESGLSDHSPLELVIKWKNF